MNSIRSYLLLSLLATITAVTFLSLLQGYRSSLAKAEQLFDGRLENLAQIIVQANHDTQPRMEQKIPLNPSVFFQIWSDKKELIAQSSTAPSYWLHKGVFKAGYSNVNFNDFRWRIYILNDKRFKRWIVTAERIDVRYALADNIVMAAILPTVLAIPVAGLIIWLVLGLGLKPLVELRQQLSQKKLNDLSPIRLDRTPEELQPLIKTSNDLLQRLETAFLREQQFSADAAHELRTPISALKVQLHNLMLTSNLQHGQVKPIKEGLERMGYVVEQILTLYRHSPDQAKEQMKPLNLTSIAQKVIATEYCQIDAKQQQVSLIGCDKATVRGSQFALESLLQNLILNASKYTPDNGQIRVVVDIKGRDVLLCVEDSGPGIDEQYIDRVFERFYRVGGDQHDSGVVGCGLGLAIVQHVVTMHHARIRLARSEVLGGLAVHVIFKLVEA